MIYYETTICCVIQHGGGTETFCCWVHGGGPAGTRVTVDVWFVVDNAGHWLQEQVHVHGSWAVGCWVPTVSCWCVGSCWTVAVVGSCPDIWGGGDDVSVIGTVVVAEFGGCERKEV